MGTSGTRKQNVSIINTSNYEENQASFMPNNIVAKTASSKKKKRSKPSVYDFLSPERKQLLASTTANDRFLANHRDFFLHNMSEVPPHSSTKLLPVSTHSVTNPAQANTTKQRVAPLWESTELNTILTPDVCDHDNSVMGIIGFLRLVTGYPTMPLSIVLLTLFCLMLDTIVHVLVPLSWRWESNFLFTRLIFILLIIGFGILLSGAVIHMFSQLSKVSKFRLRISDVLGNALKVFENVEVVDFLKKIRNEVLKYPRKGLAAAANIVNFVCTDRHNLLINGEIFGKPYQFLVYTGAHFAVVRARICTFDVTLGKDFFTKYQGVTNFRDSTIKLNSEEKPQLKCNIPVNRKFHN